MSTLRLAMHQIRADSAVTGLVALVVGIGCAVGAAAPSWATTTLDDALRDTIVQSDSNLTFRDRSMRPTLEETETFLDTPAEREPLLEGIYGDGRWVINTTPAPVNNNPFNQISLRTARDITDQITIVDGQAPSEQPEWDIPPPWYGSFSDGRLPLLTVDAVITDRVADALNVSVGDTVTTSYGAIALEDDSSALVRIAMRLTGTFEPNNPEWVGWQENHDALRPYTVGDTFFGSVLAPPEALDDISLTEVPFRAEWILPPDLSDDLTDAAAITESVRRLEANNPGWTTALDRELERYQGQLMSATRVNALGGTSLAALFAIVMLLTVRLLAGRRSIAQHLIHTRGGRTATAIRQLALEALLIGGPAAAAGTIAGAWLVTGRGPSQLDGASLVAPAGMLVLVVVSLPLVALWLARHQSGDRPEHASLRPSIRTLSAEAGFVALTAVVLWILSGRTASGSGVDPLASLAPVVAALAAGMVTFRAMPYLVAGFTRWARGARGATPFLSAARTSRAGGSATMPVIAILIAVGLAAMSASVDGSAERARQATSWNSVPADLVIADATAEVSDAEIREALPGATDVAVGYALRPEVLEGPGGRPADASVLAVDVDTWQRITDESPDGVPAVRALSGSSEGDVPAILVGSSNAVFADGDVTIDGVTAIVTAELPVYPGVPRSPTIVLPLSAVADQVGDLTPTTYYFGGEVSAEQAAGLLDGTAYSRADALAEITAAPLLRATDDIFRLALFGSAGLAAAAAVLSLLVAGRSRAHSLSILHTLGLTHRQATGMVLTEVVPPAAIAAVLGIGVGSGVTLLAADALDLTALTTTLSSDGDLVLNVTGTAWTAAGVLAVVLIAAAATVLVSRRTQLGSALRVGE